VLERLATWTVAWRAYRGAMDTRKFVLAVTADDDRFAHVRTAAEEVARTAGATLILYDWDSAMLLGDPLPSIWSAEGTDTAVPDRLDPEALDAAGRSALADQVREVRSRGVEASAWLPSTHDAEALAQYAIDHEATDVFLPADLDGPGSVESTLGERGIRATVIGGNDRDDS
jgi:hypothetical protein